MKKGLIFGFLVTIGMICLTKIPFSFLNQWLKEEIVLFIKVVIIGALIIYISFRIKEKYIQFDGWRFKKQYFNQYWVLLLPFVYPGIITIKNAYNNFLSIPDHILLLIIILIKALCEEVVFRGLILAKLMDITPQKLNYNLLISSLLFSLVHLINVLSNDFYDVMGQLIYALFMGILFGIIFLKVRNVWLLGLVHGLINVCFTSQFETQSSQYIASEDYTISDYLIQIVKISLLFSPILIISYFLWKSLKKDREILRNLVQ